MGFKDFAKGIRGKIGQLRRKPEEVRTPEDGMRSVKLSEEAMSILEILSSELGARPAASAESRRAARRIAAEMEKHTDDVTLTSGRIYPSVGRSMVFFSYLFYLASSIFLLSGLPYLSLAVIACYLYALYGEIARGRGWLRMLMGTDEAANVHAVIEPEGEAEHTIIFSAHHDSAPVSKEKDGLFWKISSWKPLQLLSFSLLSVTALISFISEIVRGVFWRFNLPPWPLAVLLALASCGSALSFASFDRKAPEYSPGAGDDLSGVAAVIALLSHFSRESSAGRGLKRTRLVFASFDGEECGTAGSRLWYRDNAYLLVDPVNLNFDGLYSEDDLVFLSSDGNGLVSLSSSLASRCSSIASSMGYRIPVGRLGFLGGETDAASAALSSIEATTLSGMAPGTETPAHTAGDTPDKVSEEALSRAIAVAIRLASDIDGREEKADEPSLLLGDRKYKLSRY